MRIDAARVTPRRVSTGRTSLSGSESGFSPGGISATGGRTSSQLKKKRISSAPITNSGSEMSDQRGDRDHVVGRPGRPPRRQRPQQERQRHHEHDHDRREDQGVRQLAADLAPDGDLGALRVAGGRVPEVAGEEAAQPVEVPLDRRPVEAHLLLELGELLGLGGPAEHGARRVARENLGSPEDEHRDDEQRGQAGEDPADDETRERVAPPDLRRRSHAEVGVGLSRSGRTECEGRSGPALTPRGGGQTPRAGQDGPYDSSQTSR